MLPKRFSENSAPKLICEISKKRYLVEVLPHNGSSRLLETRNSDCGMNEAISKRCRQKKMKLLRSFSHLFATIVLSWFIGVEALDGDMNSTFGKYFLKVKPEKIQGKRAMKIQNLLAAMRRPCAAEHLSRRDAPLREAFASRPTRCALKPVSSWFSPTLLEIFPQGLSREIRGKTRDVRTRWPRREGFLRSAYRTARVLDGAVRPGIASCRGSNAYVITRQ